MSVLSNIGLTRRAGGLVMGFDAVLREIKSRRAYVTIHAADVSKKTAKELNFVCGKFDTPVFAADFTMEQAQGVVNKRCGVFAVTDENLAKLFK